MKTTIKSLILLCMAFLVQTSCKKENTEATNEQPATTQTNGGGAINTSSQIKNVLAITSMLNNGYALKEYTLTHAKTDNKLFDNRFISMDSVDYYISNGLNYLYANASDGYSNVTEDSIADVLEFHIIQITQYNNMLSIFNFIAQIVKEKQQQLESGWKISSIRLSKIRLNETVQLSVKLNLGYKDANYGKIATFPFATTAEYKWDYGTRTNPTWQVSGPQIRTDFRAKVKTNYPLNQPTLAYPYKMVYLTDASNITEYMNIYTQDYDTYDNPYGEPHISGAFSPTKIFSIQNFTQASSPEIYLKGNHLNYYLDRAIEIIPIVFIN